MTQDYIRRKHAKKAWKKQGTKSAEASLAEDKAARQRRKKRQTRRLCQGVCYKPPELTEEDRKWNGKIDDDASDDDVAAAAQVDSAIEEAVAAGKPPVQHEDPTSKQLVNDRAGKQKQPKAKKNKAADVDKEEAPEGKGGSLGVVKLSTGVHLLDPGLAAQQAQDMAASKAAAKAAAAAAGAQVVEAAALAPYPPLIRSYMLAQGFPEPTPIQESCWPVLCMGQDLLGVAEPGSGKTLAYLLPAALRLQAAGHSATTHPDSPPCLVLTPTRELAQQVAATCRSLRRLTGLRTVCIYGGVPKEQQVELLQKKPHIVVATPGRLLDLVDDDRLQLQPVAAAIAMPSLSKQQQQQQQEGSDAPGSDVSSIPVGVMVTVLDEADKMLSLGFEPQLQRLHSMLVPQPSHAQQQRQANSSKSKGKAGKRPGGTVQSVSATYAAAALRLQVMLFSATMPSIVEEAAAQWLQPDAKRVVISHSAASISKTITQVVQVCAEHKKPAKLLKHLSAIKDKASSMRNMPRVLIFANRIKTVRFLHKMLQDADYRAVMLHGQRSQPEREEAMTHFRSGKAQCELDEQDAQARLANGVLVREALLWAGIIIISASSASEPGAICISSPLLLAALMRAAVPEQDYSHVPALQEVDLQDPRRACTWMLRHGVECMSLACALAEEVQTSGLQPSEYGLRFDLARAVSAILGHDALDCKYRALPEVQVPKEVPSPGSAPRVDYLYKNGHLPQVLMEYMVLPRNQASKVRQALVAHYKSSRLYAIKFGTTCFLIIMSVQPAGGPELEQVGRLYCDICLEAANQWGHHCDLLAAAGLQAPRQAAAFAASLGAHLPEADLQTLQILLDAFPPSATPELLVEDNKVVEPVDILLLPHARLGYVRFHDEAVVHKVPLRGHEASHGIKFNGKFFAAASEVMLVQR